MIRVPGTLAGLKERSQSAYAAPAPKPVASAMGHVRPRSTVKEVEHVKVEKLDERRKNTTEAITPTPKPTPLYLY